MDALTVIAASFSACLQRTNMISDVPTRPPTQFWPTGCYTTRCCTTPSTRIFKKKFTQSGVNCDTHKLVCQNSTGLHCSCRPRTLRKDFDEMYEFFISLNGICSFFSSLLNHKCHPDPFKKINFTHTGVAPVFQVSNAQTKILHCLCLSS